MAHEFVAEARAARIGEDAQLGHVAGGFRNHAGEADATDVAADAIDGHDGRLAREMAAAGELNDIRQEVPRAGDGAVLIVNFAVDVAAIGVGHEVRRSLPGTLRSKAGGSSRWAGWRGFMASTCGAGNFHEIALMAG